jgi:hypothetical protein
VKDKYSYLYKTTDKITVKMKTKNHFHDELSGWDNDQKTEATLRHSVNDPSVHCLTSSSSSAVYTNPWRLSSGVLHASIYVTFQNIAIFIDIAMTSSNLTYMGTFSNYIWHIILYFFTLNFIVNQSFRHNIWYILK